MIRVLIVDDQKLFRDSLKFMLEQDPELSVVEVAVNGQEAITAYEQLKPDLVLMDLSMPLCNGVEATRLIKEKDEDCKILVLTTMQDDDNITMALKNGAKGYVLKDISPERLIQTIKDVVSGLSVLDDRAIQALSQKLNAPAVDDFTADSRVKLLTPRELEAVKLVGQGQNYKEISESLFVSEGRARNLVSGILQKLKLRDRIQLAIFAVKNRLV